MLFIHLFIFLEDFIHDFLYIGRFVIFQTFCLDEVLQKCNEMWMVNSFVFANPISSPKQ
jgi:hypothetical protein